MNQYHSVEIIDKNGWRKAYPLQKRLIHIGSDPQNDIVLENWRGVGVAFRHLQLIALSDTPGEFRLVNLGDTDILLGAAGDQALAPRASTNITLGEQVRLGDFSLILRDSEELSSAIYAPLPAGVAGRPRSSGIVSAEGSSHAIAVEFFLPKTLLEPDHPIEGSVIIRNLGDKPAVQFKLAVKGLHSDCYEIGAGPLLFPDAEKEVFFHLRHPKDPTLLAGDHKLSIMAKAPEAYPEENVSVSQIIHVLPYFKHGLRLVTTE